MTDRIRYLDGLRGVLAIIVFVHHYFYAFCPEMIFGGTYQNFQNSGPFSFYKIMALTPVNVFFNPGMAIHFFFLLSGYVQTRNYFINPDLSFLQKSLLKRYIRLALPVLPVLILVYLFHHFFFIRKDLIPANQLTSDWIKSLLPNSLHFFNVVKEALVNCFRGNSRYYQVLWTMPTELVNSFVVLALLMLLHNTKHSVKLIAGVLFVLFIILQEYYSVAFVAGMLLAKLEVNSEKFRVVLANPFVHFLCLLLGLYFGSYPFTGYQNAAANSVYAPISFFEVYPHIISYLIGVIFLFCFLLYSDFVQRILSGKVFLFLGEISFMFYLIHFLLLLSISPVLYSWLTKHYNNGLNLLITGVGSFAVITVTAGVLTQLFDKPAIKLSKRFAKLFF
ncbi:hypothetical protein CNR22_10110 [Sphingobacteriaceae bacterium]|nr:hypothetical protein CNR22_10110 [Sphingobacteriaceae bacterium]